MPAGGQTTIIVRQVAAAVLKHGLRCTSTETTPIIEPKGVEMKWIVLAVVVVVLLGIAGAFLVALEVQSQAYDPYDPYSSTYYPGGSYPNATGTGPEWDKYRDAQTKGVTGYADMQALMASTEDEVAMFASHTLADSGSEEAFGLLYEKFPGVSQYVKDTFRTGSFTDAVYKHAAKTVLEGPATQRDGALLFLKLPYSGLSLNATLRDEVFVTLVQAVPAAEGQFASDLAFAIGLYQPTSAQPLVDLLAHKDPEVRKTAVTALGKLERKDALADVQLLKSDSNTDVRTAAATAESTIQSAVPYTPPTYASYGAPEQETEAQKAARKSARERLGMP